MIANAKPDYLPYGAAKELMACRDLEVLMEGPAGTGKSRAVLQKIHYAAMKYPGMRGLLVRATRESLTESVLVTYEEKVLPPDSPISAGAKRETRKSYDYPNGSAIVVGGMKAHGKDATAKIMSTEYDMVACFESTELAEDDWEKLLTRLRNGRMPYQQAIADCNPAGPQHWLNQRASKPYKVLPSLEDVLPAPRDGQRQMTRLLSRHKDNPAFWDQKAEKWTPQGAKYIATLGHLTGARLARLLDGKWASTEGAVYEQFDASVHVVKPFEIPSNWRRIRAIDWGFTNPFCCQWWAIDGDGRMYLYREIYRTKTLVEDHAKQIKELSKGERIEADITDHDAEDRATYERHCAYTRAAYKGIEPGIQGVVERLRPAGDKKPRLFIFEDALVEQDQSLVAAKKPTCTATEFDNYVWPKGQDGKAMKESPVDDNNHGMDALRYAVAYVDGLPHGPIQMTGAPTIVV